MWLAVPVVAAAADQVPSSTIVAGLIALVSAALAAWLGARGTLRTADSAREAAFDKRVDDRLSRLESALEQMTGERDRYRELYAGLRVAVRERGLDPDDLSSKGAPGA